MKLYIACKDSVDSNGNTETRIIGVFSTKDKAWSALQNTSLFYVSQALPQEGIHRYTFDSELTYFWYVQKAELNALLNRD